MVFKVELKEKYKFRIILDETWSFGVLGRTGRGLTEAQNVDPTQIDMIVGSLAGPLCAGGGFCAGAKDVVEHQRISAASYTFSAALPAMTAMTASESLNVVQSNPEILTQCRENIRLMRAQLDPRSEWVMCTSAPENPIMIMRFKPEVITARRLTTQDQERLLQECVDEVRFLPPSHRVWHSFVDELPIIDCLCAAGSYKWCPHHAPQGYPRVSTHSS